MERDEGGAASEILVYASRSFLPHLRFRHPSLHLSCRSCLFAILCSAIAPALSRFSHLLQSVLALKFEDLRQRHQRANGQPRKWEKLPPIGIESG